MAIEIITIARGTSKSPHLSTLFKPQFRYYIAKNYDEFNNTTTTTPYLEHMIRNRCLSGRIHLEEALGYLNSLTETRPLPSIWSFEYLFDSLSKMGHYSIVVSKYRFMLTFAEFRPQLGTLNLVMRCYCLLGRADLGFSLLGDIIKRGLGPDKRSLSTLIGALLARGSIGIANDLFHRIEEDKILCDEVTYAIVIQGLCKARQTSMAIEVLRRMYEKCWVHPDARCFGPIIHALCKEKRINSAFKLFDEMIGLGLSANIVVCTSLVQGLCKCGRWDEAMRYLVEMRCRHGVFPDEQAYNVVVDWLCKSGNCRDALFVFELMLSVVVKPSVVTFSSLLHGLCVSGECDVALWLFETMIQYRVRPSIFMCVMMCRLLCKQGRIADALNVFETMTKIGVRPNVIFYNHLIHGCFDSGEWLEGHKLVNKMIATGVMPNVVTFTVLAYALFKQGKIIEALLLLKDMILEGLVPDQYTRQVLTRILSLRHKLL